jgi:hypothetical protein
MTVNWQYFPKSNQIPGHLLAILDLFNKSESNIESSKKELKSNEVLLILRDNLLKLGFKVEKGNRVEDRIKVPVLFGRNGHLEKYFAVDAYHENNKTVLEVEAGRAVTNYQFLKDFFEACMMSNVDYLVVAVRKIYRNNKDFENVSTHFETLYASGRLKLPLIGVLIIGY